MDGSGNFEWVNEGFTSLYGLTFEQFLLKRGGNIFECANTEEILNQLNKCISEKETVSYEFHYVYENGNHVWAQTTITPILNDDGEIAKLIAIDSDITNLKNAEQEILKHKSEIEAQRDYSEKQKEYIELQNIELEKHHSNLEQLVNERTAELELAKNHAEESDRLKSAFLANMSHEIRTPMNAIVGFSNFLKDADLTIEEKEEYVHQINSNSDTLLHLIDDILDLSKIEAGQLTINNKSFDINKLLTNLDEVFHEKLNKQYNKNIQLRLVQGYNESSLDIFSDQLRVQQIISNLIDNAIKFTDSGYVEYGYLLIEDANKPRISIYVKDTGIGLSPDQISHIFNRFTKVENFKKFYRGTGLGLAICKNLANLLSGEIAVESELGKGSTFYFTLPFNNIKSIPDTKTKSESKQVSNYNWSGKTILIAEDEKSNFRLLEVMLNKTNLIIIHAVDGIDAIQKFENNAIDLILMDIKMPIMNGLDATREIKKRKSTVPIVAQTAYAMQDDEKMSINAGCNEYISKPITQQKLFSLLSKYLS
jgi:PAS domain S-box-containing protein